MAKLRGLLAGINQGLDASRDDKLAKQKLRDSRAAKTSAANAVELKKSKEQRSNDEFNFTNISKQLDFKELSDVRKTEIYNKQLIPMGKKLGFNLDPVTVWSPNVTKGVSRFNALRERAKKGEITPEQLRAEAAIINDETQNDSPASFAASKAEKADLLAKNTLEAKEILRNKTMSEDQLKRLKQLGTGASTAAAQQLDKEGSGSVSEQRFDTITSKEFNTDFSKVQGILGNKDAMSRMAEAKGISAEELKTQLAGELITKYSGASGEIEKRLKLLFGDQFNRSSVKRRDIGQ
jgi:hypothetical protein